jgi:small nuclear ribonucleoprotein (snRNP)-like protein
MESEIVKKWINKKVVLILKNGFKYTVIIPYFEGNSFNVKDKYNNNISIDCEMISLIVPYKSKDIHE